MTYIHWGKDGATIYDRSEVLLYHKLKDFLISEQECLECPIFDKQNKKCTHPKMGVSASELRIEPWKKWVECPIKLSKVAAQAQKS